MPIPTGGRPFDRLAAELIAWQVADQPVLGTHLGLTDHDDRLPDMSAGAVAARERAEDAWLRRFAELPDGDLTHEEWIDRDLVVMVLTGRRLMHDWYGWRRNPDAYAGPALNGVYLLLLHRPSPEPELAAAVAERLRATPELLAQGEANLDADLASPELVRRALGMVRAGAAYARGVPAEFAEEHRHVVGDAAERAGAAFDTFAAHLADLAERGHGDWAIGERRYDGLLRHAEGLSYGAREMRERGAARYAELAADLGRRSRRLRGDDDWRGLLDELTRDHPATPEQMLDAYREATAAARRFCADNQLVTLPEGERCHVLPAAPFVRPIVAVAHYIAPPPFAADGRGGRTGTFFVPYPPSDATPEQVRQRLATNSFSARWTISAHEAYPGHHWHLSHAAATLRRPLRFVFGSTYFSEGWALYAEEMMREQGFFTDPRHELCQVEARAFRAARVVVDTSLHLGEMSIAEAVEHMSTKSSLTTDTARAEVLRYCAWPTQAASYLTGALEIQRLSGEWLHTARGSLRDFHDAIAGTGRLPISLVERCLAAVPLR